MTTITLDKDQLAAPAGNIVNSILQAPSTQKLWETYHRSESKNNPAHEIAKKIEKANGDFREDPELLAFMRKMVDIEYRASSKKDTDLRQALSGLRDYLDLQALDIELPKTKKLSKDYRSLLRTIQHHTAQGGWGPVYTMRKILRDTGHHVWEEIKENPKSSIGLSLLGIGGATFMTMRVGGSSVSYIDPEALKTNDMSMDAILDPDYIPTATDTLLNTESDKVNVHSHLNQILEGVGYSKEDAAEITKDIDVPAFLHYDRIKTLASDAQGWMNGAYDWWNTRIQWFTEDTSRALSNQVFQESAFKQAFDSAAHYTAETWYAINTYENFVFHTLVTFTGAAITYRAVAKQKKAEEALNHEEVTEHVNEVKDFKTRSWANSKLSYMFAAAGAATGWMTHADEQLPWAVLMGVGGMLAGEGVHRLKRHFNKSTYAEQSTINVREDLARFSDPSKITYNQRSTDDIKRPNFMERAWKQKRALAVATGMTVLSAADIAFNNGQLTGYFTGGLMVTAKFFGFNAVEDTAAHLIFGAVGGVFGLAAGGLKLGAQHTINVSRSAVNKLTDSVRSLFSSSKPAEQITPKKDGSLSSTFADPDVCTHKECELRALKIELERNGIKKHRDLSPKP